MKEVHPSQFLFGIQKSGMGNYSREKFTGIVVCRNILWTF